MLRRLLKTAVWTLALAWLAGCVWVAMKLPPVPRAGWQPPAGQFALGFLGDSPWLVTSEGALFAPRGPIRRWNIDTGEAVDVGPMGAAGYFYVAEGTCYVCSVEFKVDGGSRLRLIHGFTGEEVWSGENRAETRLGWGFPIDEAMRLVAFSPNTGDQRVELHDVHSRKRLAERLGFEQPFISPDGSLWGANRIGAPGNRLRTTVWETATGKEVADFEWELQTKNEPPGPPDQPTQIAWDNSKVLLAERRIYDLKKKRWLAGQAADQSLDANTMRCFSRDSRFVLGVEGGAEGAWLTWREAETGALRTEMRLRLSARPNAGLRAYVVPRLNRRYVTVIAMPIREPKPPSSLESMLDWWPAAKAWLFPAPAAGPIDADIYVVDLEERTAAVWENTDFNHHRSPLSVAHAYMCDAKSQHSKPDPLVPKWVRFSMSGCSASPASGGVSSRDEDACRRPRPLHPPRRPLQSQPASRVGAFFP